MEFCFLNAALAPSTGSVDGPIDFVGRGTVEPLA